MNNKDFNLENEYPVRVLSHYQLFISSMPVFLQKVHSYPLKHKSTRTRKSETT